MHPHVVESCRFDCCVGVRGCASTRKGVEYATFRWMEGFNVEPLGSARSKGLLRYGCGEATASEMSLQLSKYYQCWIVIPPRCSPPTRRTFVESEIYYSLYISLSHATPPINLHAVTQIWDAEIRRKMKLKMDLDWPPAIHAARVTLNGDERHTGIAREWACYVLRRARI